MKRMLLWVLIFFSLRVSAQKVDAIYFHLYTDSLKKGFYNYINVDGKCADGSWMPLDTTQIKFTATTGRFKGNDLFIDSSYKAETITVKAVLRSNPAIWKEVVIYIRKRGFDEPLKSGDDMLDDMRTKGKRKKSRLA